MTDFPKDLFVVREEDGDDDHYFIACKDKTDVCDTEPKQVATYQLVEVKNLVLKKSIKVVTVRQSA